MLNKINKITSELFLPKLLFWVKFKQWPCSAGSWEDTKSQGRELAWTVQNAGQAPNQKNGPARMVQAEGGLLVRIEPCLYGEKTKTGWGLPVWYNPRAGLRLHGSHADVDGEELGLSWENNFHVCAREHGLFLGWPSLPCCFICYLGFLSLSWLFAYYSYFSFLFSCGDLWFNKITTIM